MSLAWIAAWIANCNLSHLQYFGFHHFDNLRSDRLTQNLMNPVVLASRYPNSKVLHDEDSIFFRLLAGMSSGLLFTVFFSFLPQLFKFVAFYEGTSSSMEKAERKALLFYWYFMLVTAFTGSSLANMLLQWFASGK